MCFKITAIVSISVSIAMFCLIQLYLPVSSYLQPQKPLLKLVSVKAVGAVTSTFQLFVSPCSRYVSLPYFLASLWTFFAHDV